MRSRLALGITLSALSLSSPGMAGEASRSTGICYRRVTALDRSGAVVNRYESVIVRPSASLAADIKRLQMVSGPGGPLENADITGNRWIAASISDDRFDGTAQEDCSHLPALRTARPHSGDRR